MTSAHLNITKTTGPWVDIDLGAACANYAMLRNAAPGAEIAAVVKCNAYGLGVDRISNALAKHENCRTFFVTYLEEGVALRGYLKGISPAPEIYVFNGPTPDTLEQFESARLTPVLNSFEQAEHWASKRPNVPAGVHIDTGMNRLGAPMADIDRIALLQNLNVTLVMSHLACSSDPSHIKNQTQRDLFIKVCEKFPDALKSLSASAGALMDDSYHFDIVRAGIALYGGSPFDQDDRRIKPVATLKAPVLQVLMIPAGDSVGYSAAYEARQQAMLATVAIGYGDGLLRAASNRAEAIIRGERAQIAGRVSMDLVTLDVTQMQNPVKVGDIAEFFGPNLPIHEAAAASDTIPYELLTGLGGRVDRRYL